MTALLADSQFNAYTAVGILILMAVIFGVVNVLGGGELRFDNFNGVNLPAGGRWHDTTAIDVYSGTVRLQGSFVEDVTRALGESGGDGCGVDLEITESLLMSDVDESIRKLRALRDAGLRIALDDFGTGYSSLAYLSRLPVDALKIDRSFVHGMTEHADGTSIITAIISLAQALRLKVIAEGVETEQQRAFLHARGCPEMQGFLMSPAIPAAEFTELLRKQGPAV